MMMRPLTESLQVALLRAEAKTWGTTATIYGLFGLHHLAVGYSAAANAMENEAARRDIADDPEVELGAVEKQELSNLLITLKEAQAEVMASYQAIAVVIGIRDDARPGSS